MAPATSRLRPVIKDPQIWTDNHFRVMLVLFQGLDEPADDLDKENYRTSTIAVFKQVFPRMHEYSWRHIREKWTTRFGSKQPVSRWSAIDRLGAPRVSRYSQDELDRFAW